MNEYVNSKHTFQANNINLCKDYYVYKIKILILGYYYIIYYKYTR